jgi:hypothetical protein
MGGWEAVYPFQTCGKLRKKTRTQRKAVDLNDLVDISVYMLPKDHFERCFCAQIANDRVYKQKYVMFLRPMAIT